MFYLLNVVKTIGGFEIEKLLSEPEPVRTASIATLFRVLPNFHECFYNVKTRKKVLYLFYKIIRKELKRGVCNGV